MWRLLKGERMDVEFLNIIRQLMVIREKPLTLLQMPFAHMSGSSSLFLKGSINPQDNIKTASQLLLASSYATSDTPLEGKHFDKQVQTAG